MKLLNREKKLVRYLTLNEVKALKNELGKANSPMQEITKNLIAISRNPNHSYWFECDCKDTLIPIMTPVCRENNSTHLRRVGPDDHNSKCPFYRVPSSKTSNDDHRTRFKEPIEEEFSVLSDPKKNSTTKEKNTNDNNAKISSVRKQRLPTLGKRLLNLLDDAGWNVYKNRYFDLSVVDIYNDFQTNMNYEINSYDIIKKLPLNEVFLNDKIFYWNNYLSLQRKLKDLKSKFDDTNKLHGLYLFQSDKVAKKIKKYNEPKNLETFQNEETNKNRIVLYNPNKTNTNKNIFYLPDESDRLKFINGFITENSGPFLVLMNIYQDFSKTDAIDINFAGNAAFAIPILSRNVPIPVESNQERIVLKYIIELFDSLKSSNRDLNIDIKKPLFDDNNDHCRPDFLIHINHKLILAIEVQGLNTDDYINRKIIIHETMSKHWKLIKVDAFNGKIEQSLDDMGKAIKKEMFLNNIKFYD